MTPLDTALRFLARRPRSEYEVRQRLRRVRLDEETVDATVARLREHGLLDDAAFAAYWIEQRQAFRPRGTRLLRAELRRLGVNGALGEQAASTTTDSADEDAYRAARKRAQTLSSVDERLFKRRIGQFLARRGFDWDTIARVVERLWLDSSVSTSSDSARAPRE